MVDFFSFCWSENLYFAFILKGIFVGDSYPSWYLFSLNIYRPIVAWLNFCWEVTCKLCCCSFGCNVWFSLLWLLFLFSLNSFLYMSRWCSLLETYSAFTKCYCLSLFFFVLFFNWWALFLQILFQLHSVMDSIIYWLYFGECLTFHLCSYYFKVFLFIIYSSLQFV